MPTDDQERLQHLVLVQKPPSKNGYYLTFNSQSSSSLQILFLSCPFLLASSPAYRLLPKLQSPKIQIPYYNCICSRRIFGLLKTP